MDQTSLALIELALLLVGAVAAWKVTGRVARGNERPVVLMASVTTWTILTGLIPLIFFWLAVRIFLVQRGEPGLFFESVFTLVAFALPLSPVLGFAHGLVASRRRRSGTATVSGP